MATYYETKATLDEIAARTLNEKKRLDQAKALIAAAVATLTAMPSQYSGFSSQLNTDAAANPNNDAWQTALAEKNLLAAEFQALLTEAEALDTAVNE